MQIEISGEKFEFWMLAVGIPFLQVVLSKSIRAYKDITQTWTTDFAGLVMYMDAVILTDPAQFHEHISLPIDVGASKVMFGVMLLTMAAFWSFCLYELEVKIAAYDKGLRSRPVGVLAFSWACCFVISCFHFAIFTGKLRIV